MYLGPIDEDSASTAFPAAREKSDGLYAWGFPRLHQKRLALAWYEHFCLFAFFPFAAIIYSDGSPAYPALAALSLAAAGLLSSTRSFHWRDLGPNDFFSEWRVLLGAGLFFVGLAYASGVLLHPFQTPLLTPTMMLLTAVGIGVPAELVYRALFFRRFGHLFKGECWATLVGALSTGLLYTMVSGALEGLIFGGVIGLVLSVVYLRTGSFPLTVVLHVGALLALQSLAPGIAI